MIKINLDRIMFEQKIKVPELVEKSGINKNTLYSWQNGKATRIDLSTLDALCTSLDCEPGDLLVREK